MCKICSEPSYYICKNCTIRLNNSELGQATLRTLIYTLLHDVLTRINSFKKYFANLQINQVILLELEELNFECQGMYLILETMIATLNYVELTTTTHQIISIKDLSYNIRDLRRTLLFYIETNVMLLETTEPDLIELQLIIKDLIFLIAPNLSLNTPIFNMMKELRSLAISHIKTNFSF